jgi:hypothetical protein
MRIRHQTDREVILDELRGAETVLAFYITKKGDNRAVFTDLDVPLFLFLLVVLSRNIEIYDFIKKVMETIEKYRELPLEKHILEAVEYIHLKQSKPIEK